ncbi:hypothetical protein WR25_12982 [Diploscapter pachys]|uniref:Spen paralogue and orthologue SPOC C-terminal domain-containing protein n=1 Tax=Diploscapter pachys TaxID=2018661 RepID=A0A2A2LKA4_9BILA|nr:hypothetical protein WR25_12982 [Diploscapter pachys]
MNGSLTVQKLALIDPEMLKCDESLAPLRPAEVQVSGDTQDSVESVETPTTVAVAAEEPSTSKIQTTAEATKQQTPLFTLKTSIPGLGYAVPKKKVPTRQQVPANALDSILGDGKRDTTSQHLSHFFDANCSICATKMKSNAEAEKKDREEKEKMKEEIKKKRQELKITDRSLEFDSKRSSDYRFNDRDDDYDDNDYASPAGENSPGDRWNEADEDRDRDRDWNARPGRGSSRKDDSANRSGGDSWRRSENWRYNEDEDENYRRGDRDFDRRRREEEEEREERDERRPGTSRDERSEVRRRDAEGVKITKQQLQQLFMNPIIWRGQIVFNGVVFVSSLVALSGSSCFELTGQLPVSLKITGRIAPIVVFDYFSSIRLNKMYSIALYQIEQPMDDEGSRRFINLYMDMINKDRNFVIEVPCPLVREAYLLPLQPGQDPPAYLLPFDGPGILMSHGHMILCIMTLDTEPQGLDEVLPKAKAAVDGRISQLSNSSPRTDAASHGSADAIPPHSCSLPAPVPAPILAASAPMTTPTAKLDSSHDSDVVPLNESKRAPVPAPALKDISSTSNAPEQQQSDELFPANFFDRIREKGQQQDESGTAATDSISAVVPMDPNSVRTLEDLLLYIELTESPKLIKDVVARFMADDSIPEEQKELIRTRVVNKITAAKNKRKIKDGEKNERRSKDDEQQGKEATVSAENDFQPTDECSTFADQTLHSVIDSARSKLNGSNEVGIDAARGDPTHSREIVPVSSMSMVGEAGSVRGPHTPEFDISEKYTIPPSSSAGDVSHPSAEASFPPLPTIPPPPSKRTLPSALGPFGMPPPMTSMAPPLFNTSAPPPLYPSHPGPLYNAPLPQFPPSQSLFNQPVPATPFVAAHIDSTSNRGSIIDFFNSAGGFKPTTEIAPIPPELIHNKSIFSGGIAPGFGRTRSESRSPSPNDSPRSPQIGPGPSLSSERRPTIRPSTIAGRRILPGARAVRPPRPPRTPSPDPYELVRKQVIEERDRRRAQEADEKEERRRRLEEERRDYKERKRKREEEMLESLPGPVKVQRGLWDERMDELSQQAAEKSRAVNAEIRGGEMSSRLSDDEDPNKRKNNREGRGSREWKKPMVAQDQDAWQEENPWKKKKIRGKKKKKLVDGAAGGQEQTETEQGEVDEGDETNTAKETMDAQTVMEKTPQEAANKDKETNRFDDFNDSDIGMSFEKQPEKEKEQQQEEPQENPFWDVEMPVLEFGSTKHRDVPPQRREKQPPPPPKNRGKGKGQQQQRHGAEPWKKNKQNMRGGRMSGNYLPYDNGYDDGGYDESYDDWAGGNAEPYLNQAYQAPDAWKRNRPNMRGKIFEGLSI